MAQQPRIDPPRLDPYGDTPNARSDYAPRLDDEFDNAEPLLKPRGGAGRGTMIAIAIAVVLGFAFYTFNTTVGPVTTTATTPAMTTGTAPAITSAERSASEPSRPAVPPGVRDVTPYNNDTYRPETTGSAAPQPKQ